MSVKIIDPAIINAIAKDIREELPDYYTVGDRPAKLIETATITKLALRIAKRVPDPVGFLNACSPNVDLYPLGDLWNE